MKFSIITINRNNAVGLRRTIESVVNQSCRDFEYIVIDGASTDGSVDVIKEYADRIDYWVSEADNGIYQAMNKGVSVAHGDYCNFMNSGDTFVSNDVLKQVASAKKTEDIVCGDLQYGDESLCISPEKVTMKDLYKRSLYHQATFILTKLLREHPYDEMMRSAADWKFFLQTLVFDNVSYAHIHCTVARFEPGGFSSSSKETGHNELMQELRKMFPPRVLDDYEQLINGKNDFQRLFMTVEHSRICSMIYAINVLFIKIIGPFIGAKWIKQYSMKLRKGN